MCDVVIVSFRFQWLMLNSWMDGPI